MALITTVTDSYQRISMHGVRRQLLARQARAIGLPLVEVPIPVSCPNEVYEQRTDEALRSPPLRDISTIAYGDCGAQVVSHPNNFGHRQVATMHNEVGRKPREIGRHRPSPKRRRPVHTKRSQDRPTDLLTQRIA